MLRDFYLNAFLCNIFFRIAVMYRSTSLANPLRAEPTIALLHIPNLIRVKLDNILSLVAILLYFGFVTFNL